MEVDLPVNTWNEYWRKKQELDKSANPDNKDETLNGTVKSNELESTLKISM